jgi:hypothetical protein
MWKLLLILIILGCGADIAPSHKLEEYVCTKEQLELVRIEFEICNESGFISSYCFEQAKKTQCTKIKTAMKESG